MITEYINIDFIKWLIINYLKNYKWHLAYLSSQERAYHFLFVISSNKLNVYKLNVYYNALSPNPEMVNILKTQILFFLFSLLLIGPVRRWAAWRVSKRNYFRPIHSNDSAPRTVGGEYSYAGLSVQYAINTSEEFFFYSQRYSNFGWEIEV